MLVMQTDGERMHFDHVTSSDPEIASVATSTCTSGTCPDSFEVTALQPGTFVATIYNTAGAEIDEIELTISR
jgi:hypothetical protein